MTLLNSCAALIALCLVAVPAFAAQAPSQTAGGLLLTVLPNEDGDRGAYLCDIAAGAGAVVVKTYTALSLSADDPILLLIRSDANDSETMMELLRTDRRVLSATPNRPIRAVR